MRTASGYHRRGKDAYINVIVDGARLREVRLQRLMERPELAAQSGVSQSAVARIELGQATARASTIKKLSEVLQIDPSEVILGEAALSGRPKAQAR